MRCLLQSTLPIFVPLHAGCCEVAPVCHAVDASLVLDRNTRGRDDHLFNRRRHRAGTTIFQQEEAEIRGRFGKWHGIPRFVLHQIIQEHQDSLDKAIRECSISTLRNSFTNLTADRTISHKLIHVTVRPGLYEGPSVIVEGCVLNSLIFKCAESTDRDVAYFLASSRGYTDIASTDASTPLQIKPRYPTSLLDVAGQRPSDSLPSEAKCWRRGRHMRSCRRAAASCAATFRQTVSLS